ncbi:VTT domain-containing protein [Methanohalobium sp.]|uniref:VTT domain-containing protein n=1 Tax=Methanohalobium sp. TaxID=2837493 RepID=UPI0025FAAD4D|nr:VTT domain-containing protein [Methanohalobium sp.]
MKNFRNGWKQNKNHDRVIIILIFTFIVFWNILLYYYPPSEIVSKVGVQNVYILAFLLAMIGGVSAFTSTSFYITLVTLSAGGADPVYMGVFASIGLTLGDLLFYYLGKKGKQYIPERYGWGMRKLSSYVQKIKDRYIGVLIFTYSLTPLPSDLLALTLAVIGYPLKYMIIPLLLGNFALISIMATLSQIGFNFLT